MTGEDFAKKMVEMINQKKKFYAEQKAKAKRSKPMTQAQQRDYMSTFIKNQSSWKLTQLKKLTFNELKTEFEKLVKSIENFMPMETEEKDEVVKEEETEVPVKKTRMRRKQKARKRINIDKTAQDEFNKEREAYVKDKIISQSSQKAAYQIIRKDGSNKIYMSFGAILKDFSRDELIELYRLVIKKYGANTPEEMYDRVHWGDLKTMFDPPLSDDAIWNRKYPLSKDACQMMLKMKLLDGTMDEVCYQLLKMIEKQAGIRNCEEKTKTKRQMFTQCFNIVALELSKGANSLQAEEFELPWMLEMKEDLFTCDTPLGATFDEFNRLSRMDDDLFTYEEEKSYAEAVIFINKRLVRLIYVTVEQWLDLKYRNHETMDKKIKNGVIETWLIQSYKYKFNDYVEIKRKNDVFKHDTDMEYDPSDVEFAEWMALKFSNHSMMDWYTKNALWMYWIRRDDEEVLIDKELSDLEETYVNEEDKIAKIFRMETNIFDFETPLCKAFNEFNYLLKIDTDFLTHDIPGFKTYEEYRNAWIHVLAMFLVK
ncbi:hypothetical protein Tco_1221207 [Tanacetum coccineum]